MTPIEPRHAEEAARLANEVERERAGPGVWLTNNFTGLPHAHLPADRESFVRTLARHEAELLARDEREKAMQAEYDRLKEFAYGEVERAEAMQAAIVEAERAHRQFLDTGERSALLRIGDVLKMALPTPQPDPLVAKLAQLLSEEGIAADWNDAERAAKFLAASGVKLQESSDSANKSGPQRCS